jgi:hypothetical protein
MQKFIAIVCLIAFFALQYGKLVSYWHCRMVSITAATPCDCVKQLLDVHKDNIPHTAATVKEKTEEIVLFYEPQLSGELPIVETSYTIAYIDVMPENHTGSVFLPPRL